jgi:hypothetical protein
MMPCGGLDSRRHSVLILRTAREFPDHRRHHAFSARDRSANVWAPAILSFGES